MSTPIHETPHVERSLKRLAAAILINALEDLTGHYESRRDEVLGWISRRDTNIFSFEFCCRLLGRDPNELRRRVTAACFESKSMLGMRVVASRTTRQKSYS